VLAPELLIQLRVKARSPIASRLEALAKEVDSSGRNTINSLTRKFLQTHVRICHVLANSLADLGQDELKQAVLAWGQTVLAPELLIQLRVKARSPIASALLGKKYDQQLNSQVFANACAYLSRTGQFIG
jgi:hypothetical protein